MCVSSAGHQNPWNIDITSNSAFRLGMASAPSSARSTPWPINALQRGVLCHLTVSGDLRPSRQVGTDYRSDPYKFRIKPRWCLAMSCLWGFELPLSVVSGGFDRFGCTSQTWSSSAERWRQVSLQAGCQDRLGVARRSNGRPPVSHTWFYGSLEVLGRGYHAFDAKCNE